ncbi:type II toxin-antitoxin system PrlF family antitoxin [Methylobacterium nonmethylotrophicum]|uniref:Regulator n=1 Tax=Methylobacterium nonmethylotrophicum TaxID=1141884 RepID=A0A4Z0NQF3_9HYPH|nr:type II toxin-antitoxin system PrlF family antitoxin [Methylobacterium nonmethylotrophicum]TGD98279.1 regulator [Methylobacterium nonmethylotrophicum]
MSKTAEILEIPATITARGQTTVPAAVRRMLGVGKSGRIVFRGLADGTVVIAKADAPVEEDPALRPFLALLERDLMERPQAVAPVGEDLYQRALALTSGVEVDLDEALSDDEE